jgi:predicted CXXCH cytochrome family protein
MRPCKTLSQACMAKILAAFLVALGALSAMLWSPADASEDVDRVPAPVGAKAEGYIGSRACAVCHEPEAKAWAGSHHELAMQDAAPASVLGDFNGATLDYSGVASTFFRRGEKFVVRTDGPDGKLADYEIKYTFGVFPLQQYLIAFPDGRLQALGLAWDARPKTDGGQRWFHLYPNEQITHKDPLHWTSRYQSWNLQCAHCHSTNVRKGYDAARDAYDTTFSEIGVGCEACHGPGSRHLAWAATRAGADNGLTVHPFSRWREAWRFPQASAAHVERDAPAAPATNNVCAPCHARRSLLFEGAAPGAPLEDAHRLALVTPPNYHADGQQNDEVFVWGSFKQSKMFEKGVTCVDCHEPHALSLRAEGNGLCARCHNAEVFDTPKHHHHPSGSAGAECANCHMPAKNYMVVDARRDHFIRVPRPDISAAVGSPDACTGCHAGRPQTWAIDAMDRWYGAAWRDRPQDALALHGGVKQNAAALPDLLNLAANRAKPAIVRASAAALAEPMLVAPPASAVAAMLNDADPLARLAGLNLGASLPADARIQAALPLLEDALRGVRAQAGRTLADVAVEQLPTERRASWEKAISDYLASLQTNLDWPETNLSLGAHHAAQGRYEEAVAAYERALALDPSFVAAYANLADLQRMRGGEDEAERILRRGLAAAPNSADLRHALGLALVRKNERGAALVELAEAAKLAPDNAHYAYVHAVALDSAGRREEALGILQSTRQRHPGNIEILVALITMNKDAGDLAAARVFARELSGVLPDNLDVRRLVEGLERSSR